MYAHAVIGKTGSGKSSLIRELFLDGNEENCLVFDINDEYEINDDQRIFDDENHFIDTVENTRNCIAVFEEATIYLSHANNSKRIRSLLVKKRHKNQHLVFVFHHILAIPYWLFPMIDKFYIFRTLDNMKKLEKKSDTMRQIQQYLRSKKPEKYTSVIFEPAKDSWKKISR